MKKSKSDFEKFQSLFENGHKFDVWTTDSKQKTMVDRFKQKHGQEPELIVLAPLTQLFDAWFVGPVFENGPNQKPLLDQLSNDRQDRPTRPGPAKPDKHVQTSIKPKLDPPGPAWLDSAVDGDIVQLSFLKI